MYIICHYAEIALKGKNRKLFEEKLVGNIKSALSPTFFKYIKRISGRIIIELKDKIKSEKEFEKITGKLKNVFGLSHFSFAEKCSQDIEEIQKKSLEMLEKTLEKNKGAFWDDRPKTHPYLDLEKSDLKTKIESVKKVEPTKIKTFKVETQRSEKDFYLTSPQINEKVGEFILNNLNKKNDWVKPSHLKVDLKNPDIIVFIEIVEKYTFVYSEKIPGPGGLPVGISGRAISLISGGIDSPVASFLTMKRGVEIIFVHFIINQSPIEKIKRIVQVLTKFQNQSKLYLVPFQEVQKEILEKGKEKLRCLLCKRAMLEIAEDIAKKEKIKTLITGENIGQVASQTLENLNVIGSKTNLLILRPLSGLDKLEIIGLAKKIGTFEISILKEEGCPIVPKHPETKANLGDVEENEKNIKKPRPFLRPDILKFNLKWDNTR